MSDDGGGRAMKAANKSFANFAIRVSRPNFRVNSVKRQKIYPNPTWYEALWGEKSTYDYASDVWNSSEKLACHLSPILVVAFSTLSQSWKDSLFLKSKFRGTAKVAKQVRERLIMKRPRSGEKKQIFGLFKVADKKKWAARLKKEPGTRVPEKYPAFTSLQF